MSLPWVQVQKLLHLRKRKILGGKIEFLEVQVEEVLLLLLPDLSLLPSEPIQEEVLDNQQVFVELLVLNQVMEEIVVLVLCQWRQVLIVPELSQEV